ncbi:hypothetical protein UFOVP22_18 [uncultured Caudovirales phage]|uniref:Uncharacterized protein n=1 Tax=uncultured Caudovirales phage TaxID=2100421 RepID=A0A6J5T7V4_9CAUD|nr:hypothetical protein UFOVP22_18 [uncultured Caudovirales phage]
MNNIIFNHYDYGVMAFVDDLVVGKFSNEQKALEYIILNGFLTCVTIDRNKL